MIWPFNIIRRREQAAEAAACREEAALEDARGRRAEVTEIVTWARQRREENHLSALFRESLRGERG